MSLWLDMLGVEIRFVETKSFGRIRIAEAGCGNPETILFMHGINGHLEAYAKNLVSLGRNFHVLAFDFVGHGLSDKPVIEYSPLVFSEQLGELMDALGLEAAHLSGESLGGWVSAFFAVKYPERVKRLMLNTAAGIPVVSEKGKADLANLIALNQRNVQAMPTRDSVRARLEWLMHENNRALVNDELISLRLGFYLMPETQRVAPIINGIINRHDEFLVPFEQLQTAPLFLWTADNPIHDLDAARAAARRVPDSQIYVMEGDSAHWPQYEAPDEFDRVATEFFTTGKVSGCAPL
ncbi:alpha/beta fold hydrolase [Thauera linaloolentis]|uniref:Alpha/beta hydrolase fold protein n=1 Tax=Thauera linaloolentis (strain DSM 12138 / JCM 21573 / CCUG 41526 / CIP 105981 / IAM 15112 / NBRC 102519 / 47Lol) TaxID=1123367 RepID=N6YZJ9_THAL4|nr:alpha/beta hydrolase [Thauera linaloolentis]ENO87802.1 alpha/beta hydrolase fold protein [Thauera linaloolentis 47Lol = DSM 12138]MCM8565275.1 alpha/beta hydrolase [Thauera linaloolentis]